MIRKPDGMSAFLFSVMSGLRAVQLSRGCTPRVISDSKLVIVAQLEVAGGFVERSPQTVDPVR